MAVSTELWSFHPCKNSASLPVKNGVAVTTPPDFATRTPPLHDDMDVNLSPLFVSPPFFATKRLIIPQSALSYTYTPKFITSHPESEQSNPTSSQPPQAKGRP
jgi:hypothetical protein